MRIGALVAAAHCRLDDPRATLYRSVMPPLANLIAVVVIVVLVAVFLGPRLLAFIASHKGTEAQARVKHAELTSVMDERKRYAHAGAGQGSARAWGDPEIKRSAAKCRFPGSPDRTRQRVRARRDPCPAPADRSRHRPVGMTTCCGDGIVQANEECEPGLPSGNPDRCPTNPGSDCNQSGGTMCIEGTNCLARCVPANPLNPALFCPL
jgi:type II secretory pathway pseudopilin PulG